MTKIARIGLSLLLIIAFAMPVLAGPFTRTVEIEAYKEVSVDVYADCDTTIVDYWADLVCDEYYQAWSKWGNWLPGECGTGDRERDGYCMDEKGIAPSCLPVSYRHRLRTKVDSSVCKDWDLVCNDGDVLAGLKCFHADCTCEEGEGTLIRTVTFDAVVTEIMLGDSITVKGHIWTNKPKPVTYWYVAQLATIPADAKTVAKSDKISIPDVDGVFATDSFTFTPKKAGIYRIFLRILKVDGTMGEIRTKVVVTARQDDIN